MDWRLLARTRGVDSVVPLVNRMLIICGSMKQIARNSTDLVAKGKVQNYKQAISSLGKGVSYVKYLNEEIPRSVFGVGMLC